MADEPTTAKSPTRRQGAAASTDTSTDAGSATAKTAAAASDASRSLPGSAPGGRAPLRDQEISEAARNPEPITVVENMPEGTNAPDYSAANTNSLRSSATPIDHPGIRTRDEHNQDRIALAAGQHSIPGQGHLGLVGEDGAALTFADVFPDYAGEGQVGVAAVRVYERFTQPNVKARNASSRLLFHAGQRVDAFTVNRFRLAMEEETAARASVEGDVAVAPTDPTTPTPAEPAPAGA